MSDATPYWRVRGLLGADDAARLQAEGWEFNNQCFIVGDSMGKWGCREKVLKIFFFANPDDYPEAWQMPEEAQPAEQLTLL